MAGWFREETWQGARRMFRLVTDAALWECLSAEGHCVARQEFHLPTQNGRLVHLCQQMRARTLDVQRRPTDPSQGWNEPPLLS